MCTRSRGFSLIEMLVVLGVIGVLLGLLMPAVQNIRASASQAACQNNLKQIGIALHSFESTHGRLPPDRAAATPVDTISNDPKLLLSWQVLILPEIEQSSLWEVSRQACQDQPLPFRNPPHVGYSTVIPLYVCLVDARLRSTLRHPSGDEAAFTSYIGVSGYLDLQVRQYLPGMLGVQLSRGTRLADVVDGTSQTLMVTERPPPTSLQAGRWYGRIYNAEVITNPGPDEAMLADTPKPLTEIECRFAGTQFGPGRIENPCDRYHFWSLHLTGANFLFADGSLHFLRYSARDVIPALATRAGGESVSLD